MPKLQGKVALVTGGRSGIGLATAKRFVEEGAFVYITARRQTELDKAALLIGRNVAAVRGDVSKLADLDRLYTKIASEKGKIDILFGGAGIVDPQPLAETTEESFDKLFAINTRALAFTVKKALPLLNDGGAIIVITSIAENKGIPGFTAYSASKAAVRSFVRTWTAELKDRRIRVNAISPGPIDTPIFEQQAPTKEGADHRWRGPPSRWWHDRDLKLSASRLRRHPRRGRRPLSDAFVRQAWLPHLLVRPFHPSWTRVRRRIYTTPFGLPANGGREIGVRDPKLRFWALFGPHRFVECPPRADCVDKVLFGR